MLKYPVIILSLLTATSADAAILYSENFNDVESFQGGIYGLSSSDKYASALYAQINNAHGWVFVGDSEYVFNTAQADGALLLNEFYGSAEASVIISGLNSGKTYYLSFDYYGDNQPFGSAWTFGYRIDSNPIQFIAGIDHGPGAFPGLSETYAFVASGPTAVLWFKEFLSANGASPIIDNVLISDEAVPEPASWAMMIAGLGLAGTALRRRRLTLRCT